MIWVWLTFIGVLAVVFGFYWFWVAVPEGREQSKIRRRLKGEEPVQVSRVRLLKTPEKLSGIALLNALLSHVGGISAPLKRSLDLAGLRQITVATFLLVSASSFFVGLLVVNLYTGIWWLGLSAAVLMGAIPFWALSWAREKRVRKFEEQFPEAVELIARAMRAGHAFATGLKMAADEMAEPASIEFRILHDRQSFGAQLPDALRDFANRIPSIDARFFVTAVLTQREAGGNLSEVLDRLAAVMRERFRIKREVRVRSAHGRITAYVLAGMPPVLAALTLSSNPEQIKILTTDPLGIRMVMVAVVLQVLGTLIVRKLVDVEY